MKFGEKLKTEDIEVVAVYDNTGECTRCDLFNVMYDCEGLINMDDNNIDCLEDKIVFKLIDIQNFLN